VRTTAEVEAVDRTGETERRSGAARVAEAARGELPAIPDGVVLPIRVP
jgi:hypothetical protein